MRRTIGVGLLAVGIMAGSLTACSSEADHEVPIYERTGNIDGFGFTEEQSFSHQKWVHEDDSQSLPSGDEPIRNVQEHEDVDCILVQEVTPDETDDSNIFEDDNPFDDYYNEDPYADDWEFKSKPLTSNKIAGFDDFDCVQEGYISFGEEHYEVFSRRHWYSFDVLKTLFRHCRVTTPLKHETRHTTPEINHNCSEPQRGEVQEPSARHHYLFFDINVDGIPNSSTSTTLAEGDEIPSTASFEVEAGVWEDTDLHQPVTVSIQDGEVIGFISRTLK